MIMKRRTPFANYFNKINNTKVDNAIDTDAVMPMYNFMYNNI